MRNPESSLRCIGNAADHLIDDRVGVIHSLQELQSEESAPNFFHFFAYLPNAAAFNQRASARGGDGSSASRETAAARAVSKAVAYYCAALYEVERYPLAPYSQPDPAARVQPGSFALYSREQYEQPGFPWVPFDEQTPVRWAGAFDPLSGEVVYAPAAMVFAPYDFLRGSGDAPIAGTNFTGLACRCSPAAAALAALCQVIRDDALALVWQARCSPAQLRVETLSDANYEMAARFERGAGSLALLDITTDIGVTTVLAGLRSTAPEACALVCAAAADPDPEEAVRQSLENLARAHRYARMVRSRAQAASPEDGYENIRTQAAHLRFWCDHDSAPLADFLFASKERVEFDEFKGLSSGDDQRDLQTLLRRVGDAGYRALLTDLTSPDVRDLGLTAVRALIPGLHPLFAGHNMRALGGERLWEVPRKLGHGGISRESGDNPLPHPFLLEEGI